MNDAPLANAQQILDALLETLGAISPAPELEPAEDHRAAWRVVSEEGATSVCPEPPRRRTKSRDTSNPTPTIPASKDATIGPAGRKPAASNEADVAKPPAARVAVATPANSSLLAADFAGRTAPAPIASTVAAAAPTVPSAPNFSTTDANHSFATGAARDLSVDRELARLIAAWPTLSLDVRSALLAVVDAACAHFTV